MKGAFETALVIIFGMMFMVMGIDYMRVILVNNKARLYAENILAIIEHQNRYDIDVEELIRVSDIQCSVCQYQVFEHLFPYEVRFVLHLLLLKYLIYVHNLLFFL